jgi:acyl-coenzyme A synthetase/AMP-(fatty) acid ligase
MNIAEFQRANAVCRGGDPAVVDEQGVVTHRQLDERSRCIASHLARLGVARGDLVGTCIRDSAETVAVWLALARLGAPIIPMDWRWTPDEQRQIEAIFKPRLVLGEPGRRGDVGRRMVALDDSWRAAVAAAPADDRMVPGGDNPFLMNMSSGTTGLPKGNVHTHDTYSAIVRAHWIDMGQTPIDRTLAVLPMAAAAGRSLVMATVLVGGTIVFAPPLLEPAELVDLCKRDRINMLCLVPSILRGLLQIAPQEGLLLPDLHGLVSVGAMLFPEESRAVRKRLSPHLINYYGSTGGGINTLLYPDELERKPGSVGRPTLGTDLQVVDEAGNLMGTGETGRLRARGPNTCRGVYPPDPTDTSYLEGWHYPGDYALIDADGYLFLQGRYNDIIIRGGSNVYAPEVERVLLALAGIREAAVFGIPHATLGEEVVACVVADETVLEAALIRHCRSNLAAYKVPTRIHRLPALPRNSAGKILKRKLSGLFDMTGSREPTDPGGGSDR